MGARLTRLLPGPSTLAVTLCVVALPNTAAADDQSVNYRIDPGRTGAVAGPGPAPPLSRLWKRQLGSRIEYPLLAEGKVFVVATLKRTDRRELFALDAATGTTLWTRRLGEEGARIAYSKGVLFASNVGGITRALDARTGNTAWTQYDPSDVGGDSTTPIVAGEQLLESENYGDHRGATQARRTSDGLLRWRRPDGLLHPASDGTNVFTGDDCPRLLARALSDGSELWSVRWERGCSRDGSDIASVYDGKVFDRHYRPLGDYKYEGGVLGSTTGNEIRTFRADSDLAFQGKAAYYLRDGRLRAEDVDTGAEFWTSAVSSLTLAPVVIGEHVYSAAADGTLMGFDGDTGALRWAEDGGEPLPATDPGYRYPPWRGALAAGQGVLALSAGNTISAFADTPPQPAEPVTPGLTPGGGSGQRDVTVTHRGAPARTGWTESSPLRPPLTTLWSHPVTADAISYPLIADGRTFVVAQDVNEPGWRDFDSRLIAVSSATGDELWSTPLEEGHDPYFVGHERPDFGLAYGSGKVITVNASGVVQARSAVDGTVQWTAKRPGQQEAASSPVVLRDTVYIAESCQNAGYSDVRIIAHDLATGTIRGGIPADCNQDPYHDAPGLAADAQTLYLSTSSGARAIDRATGETRWSTSTPLGEFARSPSVLDGSVYLGHTDFQSFVVSARTGTLDEAFESHHAPALSRQVMVTADLGTLRASDRRGGRRLWEHTLPGSNDADNGRWFRPPLIVGDHVYSVASGGRFFVHDLASGEERWRGDLNADIGFAGEYLRQLTTGIAAGEGLIVVPTRAGLVALAGPAGHSPPDPDPEPPNEDDTTPGAPETPAQMPPAFAPGLPDPLGSPGRDRLGPSISVVVGPPSRMRVRDAKLRRGRRAGGLPITVRMSERSPMASLVVFSRRRSRSGTVRERRIARVAIGPLSAGRTRLTFFGRLSRRQRLSSGTYRLAVEASDRHGNPGVSRRMGFSVRSR